MATSTATSARNPSIFRTRVGNFSFCRESRKGMSVLAVLRLKAISICVIGVGIQNPFCKARRLRTRAGSAIAVLIRNSWQVNRPRMQLIIERRHKCYYKKLN